MTIAAHIRETSQQESFLYACLLLLAEKYSTDQFIFFADKQSPSQINLPFNCKIFTVSPAIKNSLLLHYWYNFKLPGILKKMNAAVFLSESSVCSLRRSVPQCMVLQDISFLQKKKLLQHEHARYLKKFFDQFIRKTFWVITTENYIAQALVFKYPSLQSKISSVGHGLIETYQPLPWNIKEAEKNQHTQGNEFFFCECSALTQPNILFVLKAFSLFKKRLKSNMQLMLLLKNIPEANCVNDFKNYKYRQEVKFITHQSHKKTALHLAAAYACIYLPAISTTENTGLHAMQCGVPLITCNDQAAKSIYKDAALFTSMDEKMIAENMMMLYKDEALRNETIEKGKSIAGTYNWPAAAALLWQSILSSSKD